MLKQLPKRNHRTKGFKAKQGFKIFALIVVGVWLLYQLKQYSRDKKLSEETSAKIFENVKAASETRKLGRKGLQPLSNGKVFELMEDTEENEHERDDIGHDGERIEEEESEEVEDLNDEQDKEKEEQNEDGEDIEKQMEDMHLLENEDHDEGEKDRKSESEKYNKETGASRIVMRMTKSLGSEFEFGGLKKVEEEEVGNSERIETEKQKKEIMNSSKVNGHSSDSSPKVAENVRIGHGSFPNALLTKRIDDVLDFGAGSKKDSLLKLHEWKNKVHVEVQRGEFGKKHCVKLSTTAGMY